MTNKNSTFSKSGCIADNYGLLAGLIDFNGGRCFTDSNVPELWQSYQISVRALFSPRGDTVGQLPNKHVGDTVGVTTCYIRRRNGSKRDGSPPPPPAVDVTCCRACPCSVNNVSAQERHGVDIEDESWLFFTPGTVQSMNAACSALPEGSSVMVMTPRYVPCHRLADDHVALCTCVV